MLTQSEDEKGGSSVYLVAGLESILQFRDTLQWSLLVPLVLHLLLPLKSRLSSDHPTFLHTD